MVVWDTRPEDQFCRQYFFISERNNPLDLILFNNCNDNSRHFEQYLAVRFVGVREWLGLVSASGRVFDILSLSYSIFRAESRSRLAFFFFGSFLDLWP